LERGGGFCPPDQYPFFGTRRHRCTGCVGRSLFNQAVSATGDHSVSSP
jgi:hypothetical protein